MWCRWAWKSNCISNQVGGCDWGWTVYFPTGGNITDVPIPPNGPLDPERAWLLERTHIRGALGELVAYAFNRTTRSFYAYANATAGTFEAAAARRAQAGASSVAEALPRSIVVTAESYDPQLAARLTANGSVTEVYVPASIPFPVTTVGPVTIDSMVTWPDGSRSAYLSLTGPGIYGVFVNNASDASAAKAHHECSGDLAATPACGAVLLAATQAARAARRSSLPHGAMAAALQTLATNPHASAVCSDLAAAGGDDSATLPMRAACAYQAYAAWRSDALARGLDAAGLPQLK